MILVRSCSCYRISAATFHLPQRHFNVFYKPPAEVKKRFVNPRWKDHDDGDVGPLEKYKEMMAIITQRYFFTPHEFGKLLSKRQLATIKERQELPYERVESLGPDLAIAHMLLDLGAAVKIVGRDTWFLNPRELPVRTAKDFRLEAIDAAGSHITYEGLQFIDRLQNLKFLSVRRCPFVDDFCLSRLSRLSHTLEFLDISFCPQISANGMTTLWTMRRLKRLVAYGHPMMEHRELVCLLLEDKLPTLFIEGVDYLAALPKSSRVTLLENIAASSRESEGEQDVPRKAIDGQHNDTSADADRHKVTAL